MKKVISILLLTVSLFAYSQDPCLTKPTRFDRIKLNCTTGVSTIPNIVGAETDGTFKLISIANLQNLIGGSGSNLTLDDVLANGNLAFDKSINLVSNTQQFSVDAYGLNFNTGTGKQIIFNQDYLWSLTGSNGIMYSFPSTVLNGTINFPIVANNNDIETLATREWAQANIDRVTSVNAQTGVVSLDADNIPETSLRKWTSPTEKTTWDNKQDALTAGIDYLRPPLEMVLSSDYTLTSSPAAQKLFNVGTSGNGSISVEASTLYDFELFVDLTNLSSTSGFYSFSLGGTATYTSLRLKTEATKIPLITSGGFMGVITSTAAYQMTTANVNTVGYMLIRGKIRTNGAGTLIPTITLSQASAAVVKANSYCTMRKIGSSSFTATSGVN